MEEPLNELYEWARDTALSYWEKVSDLDTKEEKEKMVARAACFTLVVEKIKNVKSKHGIQ